MHYWVRSGPGDPQYLTAEDVASRFTQGQVDWTTPACQAGAQVWTTVGNLPDLVTAIRALAPPPPQPPPPTPPPPPRALVAAPVPPPAQHHSIQADAARYAEQLGGLKVQVEAAKRELEASTNRLDLLRLELDAVEEAIELQSFGVYRPRYGFESSSEYTTRLDQVRQRQEQMIKSDAATKAEKKWVIDGSAKRGADMVRDQSRLMLRAFNGECDAAIAKVKYDNVVSLQKRIEKALAAINKLSASKHIEIAAEYSALKLEELHLVHEHREKVHEEREVQRALKEQMKDEQKAQEEIERALEQTQREEDQKEEALRRARQELSAATDVQHQRLAGLVDRLERELADTLDRKAKAIARAQLVRSGHVYVLSNLGCYGEDCYKIGMTRRFEPRERVVELGDASVPFHFDIHAMIYCEDAPALERALHERFAERRVNRVNPRKEFFRVTLSEIREAVEALHGVVTFVTVPEAEEFRKTLALSASSSS